MGVNTYGVFLCPFFNGISNVLGEYESLDELNYLAASIEAMDTNDFERFEASIGVSDYSKSVKLRVQSI